MMLTRWLILPLAGVLGAPGCTGQNAVAGTEAAVGVATVGALSAVKAAVESADGKHASRSQSSAPTLELVAPKRFDESYARLVLGEHDLSACWPKDRPHGARDVDVIFDPTGTVVHTEILPPRDRDGAVLDAVCVARELAAVRVDEFDGEAARVRFTFASP